VRYFSCSSIEDRLLRYEKDIKLAGIIYLHRITDNRMGGSPLRNLRMFGELCGDQAVKKVVLVTTMWDRGKTDPKTLHQREKELFDNYWKTMINYGASTARFDNSAASAWKIIAPILKQREAEILLLQEELVDLNRALNETQAGKTLYSDLQRLLAEQRDTVRSLAEQAREQSNPQLAQKLEAELKRIQKDFDKTFNEIKRLKIPLGKRLLLLFSKKSRAVRISIGLFSFHIY
jgi:exonuclease VII small subunit